MIVDEHITSYLHSLGRERSPLLEEMRRFAAETGVPIIRREMESLIEVLLELRKPETVLEIGTGIGFSAIFMAECGKEIRQIVTIENYPPRIALAKEYLKRWESAEEEAEIRLLEADAAETVKEIKDSFDLIFLDGPKAQYPLLLPELKRLLKPGGILLSDNVLQEGDLVKSRYLMPRRERTIHERMREFLYRITHDEDLTTTILPLGDGASVSVRKKEG